MHRFVLSLATCLAFAGTGFAQTKHSAPKAPTVFRGASAGWSAMKVAARPVAPKASMAHSASRFPAKSSTQQQVRATRYGFMMAPTPPPPPPPPLDTTSPRTLNLVNFHTQEVSPSPTGRRRLSPRCADQLNHFLRDTRESARPKWIRCCSTSCGTPRHVGFGGSVEVLSAYRSPATNAWLASVIRGVADDSQHMNGNAMDIRIPGVPVFQLRQVAGSLGMGGVGFYPRSGFVHIDTGPVRYW